MAIVLLGDSGCKRYVHRGEQESCVHHPVWVYFTKMTSSLYMIPSIINLSNSSRIHICSMIFYNYDIIKCCVWRKSMTFGSTLGLSQTHLQRIMSHTRGATDHSVPEMEHTSILCLWSVCVWLVLSLGLGGAAHLWCIASSRPTG